MTVFLLVRHGESEYVKKGRLAGRLPGVHLTEAGRKQAQALAERLQAAPIRAVYSSPLERTLETAQPLAQALGLEVILRPGLIEVDVGEWAGERLKALGRQKLWKIVQQAPSRLQFPGGETFAQAQLRVAEELQALQQLHPGQELVVCVTHSDVIRLAVAYFIGLPLDFFQRLQVAPASLTVLNLSETGAQLFALNHEISLRLPEK